jgi:hypothetical protein
VARRRAVRDTVWPWWVARRAAHRAWRASATGQAERAAREARQAERERSEAEHGMREGYAATVIQNALARVPAAHRALAHRRVLARAVVVRRVRALPAVRKGAQRRVARWWHAQRRRHRLAIVGAVVVQARWRGLKQRRIACAQKEEAEAWYAYYATVVQARWRGRLGRRVHFRLVRRAHANAAALERRVKLKRMGVRGERERATAARDREVWAATVITAAAREYLRLHPKTVDRWLPAHNRKPGHRRFSGLRRDLRDFRVRRRETAERRARVRAAKAAAKKAGVPFVMTAALEFSEEELAGAKYSVIHMQNMSMQQSGVVDVFVTVGAGQMVDFAAKQKKRRNGGQHVFERIAVDLRDNKDRARRKEWAVNQFSFGGKTGDEEQEAASQVHLWLAFGQGKAVLGSLDVHERPLGSQVGHGQRLQRLRAQGIKVRAAEPDAHQAVEVTLELHATDRHLTTKTLPIKNIAITKGDDAALEEQLRQTMYHRVGPDLGSLGCDPGTRLWVQQPEIAKTRATKRAEAELRTLLGPALYTEHCSYVIEFCGYATADVLEMKRVFGEMDRDGAGEIDLVELLGWMKEPRREWTFDLFNMMAESPKDESSQLSFARFLHVISAIAMFSQEQCYAFIFHLMSGASSRPAPGVVDQQGFMATCHMLARDNPLLHEGVADKCLAVFQEKHIRNAGGRMNFQQFKEVIQHYPALCSGVFLIQTRVAEAFLGAPFWVHKKRLMMEARRQLQAMENNVAQYHVQGAHAGEWEEQHDYKGDPSDTWRQQEFLYGPDGEVKQRERATEQRKAEREERLLLRKEGKSDAEVEEIFREREQPSVKPQQKLDARIQEMTGGWGGVGKGYRHKGAKKVAHDPDESGDEDEDRAARVRAERSGAKQDAWFKPGTH